MSPAIVRSLSVRSSTTPRPAARPMALAAGLLMTVALTAVAGPITPPPGVVAPTGKTTQEIFDKAAAAEPRIAISATNTPGDSDATPSLFKITQPGSYYLTGDVLGVSGRIGIEIAAGGVTIDLGGFQMRGFAGTLSGIEVTSSLASAVSVHNGTVRDWGAAGVDLSNVIGGRADRLMLINNATVGLETGSSFLVTNCMAYSNDDGIVVGPSNTVNGCVAATNAGDGIKAFAGSTLTGCASTLNTGAGFAGTLGLTLTACSARSNSGSGFVVGNGANITGCNAYTNGGNGFELTSSGSITGSTATGNQLNGISVSSGCIVRANMLRGNGNGGDGAGILVTGSDNRIEGNTATLADRGIDVNGAGNIIIGNTCSGNTVDWDIAANNYFGPIIDRRNVLTPAVSGFSATGTLVSADPHANFSH